MLTLYDYLSSGNGYKCRLLLPSSGIAYRARRARHPARARPARPSSWPRTRTAGSPRSSSRTAQSSPNRTRSCSTSPTARRSCPMTVSAGPRCCSGCSSSSTATSRSSPSPASSTTCCRPTRPAAPSCRAWSRAAMLRSASWSAGSRDHPFLVADRYTIADIALYAYTHVADEGGFDARRLSRRHRLARARGGPAGPHPDHRWLTLHLARPPGYPGRSERG